MSARSAVSRFWVRRSTRSTVPRRVDNWRLTSAGGGVSMAWMVSMARPMMDSGVRSSCPSMCRNCRSSDFIRRSVARVMPCWRRSRASRVPTISRIEKNRVMQISVNSRKNQPSIWGDQPYRGSGCSTVISMRVIRATMWKLSAPNTMVSATSSRRLRIRIRTTPRPKISTLMMVMATMRSFRLSGATASMISHNTAVSADTPRISR